MNSLPDDAPPLPAQADRSREALSDRERRNPFYGWLMHLGLPMGISLMVHVALFSIMGFKTWQVLAQREIEVGEYEAGITEDLAAKLGGAFQWPGEEVLETPQAETSASLDSLSDLRDLSNLDVSDFESTDDLDDSGGGFGIGEGGRGGILGLGGGAGEAGSGGFGSGFGSRQRIGHAGVWNLRVAANKIAYVIDFSGSIIVAVDDLKRELKRSIGRLKPSQAFEVTIFYSTGTADRERFKTESFGSQLQPAQTEVKRRFFEWIDHKPPMGRTEPVQAIKRAIQLDPDVIFFFSDGYFDDAYVDEITRANRAARAKIHCLVFDEILLQDTSGLPRMTDGARRLQRVAEQNGGQTKVVTGLDLQGG
ncbi:MAG: hypothetical protein KKB50_12245 [Planctomycetes bacterium]|nr:hypothetical protein [Planctomycetota bacterium]